LQADDEIQFFIHRNDNFRLPEDDSAEVIMLGAGTGIAPFRAFIQERAARDASGKNRLIFGNPHAHYDFLYQAEWQDYLDSGILSEIHLAFSRDQAEKIYVQHKVAALGADLIHALDKGAYFYVCGAKQPMSHDVEQSLIALLVQHKGLSAEAASDYLNDLSDAGRYLKDVY
jgi:sulfite reductase (NADPH) flavoprotein alpha-component